MKRVLFSVSVMAAFGGMCTGGLGGDDLDAELVDPADAVEAVPAEPELALPVDAEQLDEGDDADCCCSLPDSDPRLETAAACAELGGECADDASACDAEGEAAAADDASAAQGSTGTDATAPVHSGKTVSRPDSDGTRKVVSPAGTDGTRKVVSPAGGTDGTRKVVKPADSDGSRKVVEPAP